MMTRTVKIIVPVMGFIAAILTSCSSDIEQGAPASGTAHLSLALNTGAEFSTRALNEADWLNTANYTVDIIDNSEAIVKTYAPGDVLPTYLELPYGSYTVHAHYGTAQKASRTDFLCEGKTPVSLQSDDEKNVTVNCLPTCGKAIVYFDSEMSTYFSNYYVTFSTPALGSDVAMWAKDDVDPWYLLVDERGTLVTATIYLTPQSEYDINKTNTSGSTAEGTVVKTYTLSPNKAWTLRIAPNYTSSTGELGIEITIDDTTNDKEIDIVIPSEWI